MELSTKDARSRGEAVYLEVDWKELSPEAVRVISAQPLNPFKKLEFIVARSEESVPCKPEEAVLE